VHYQYRWYCAAMISITTFLIAYLGDIRFQYSHTMKLEKTKYQLEQILMMHHPMTRKKHAKRDQHMSMNVEKIMKSPFDLLSLMTELEYKTGVKITVLDHQSQQKINNVNIKKAHLVLQGSFNQISSFINHLAAYPVMILNFHYEQIQQQYSLVLYILIVSNIFLPTVSSMTTNQLGYNPFCNQSRWNASSDLNQLEKLRSVSLKQLKMIGYFSMGLRHRAIMSSINQMTFSLAKGDLIGKEQARVLEVSRDRVVFLLSNQEHVMMEMQH